MAQVNTNEIPNGSKSDGIKMRTVELKNVLCKNRTVKDIKAEVVPFDRFDNRHVEFAYNYSDMLYRMPSPFTNASDAAKEYVLIFMKHTEDELRNENSDILTVVNDLRAARTLFNNPDTQKELQDFFVNA